MKKKKKKKNRKSVEEIVEDVIEDVITEVEHRFTYDSIYCSVKGCKKPRMERSEVCVDCYARISYEMSLTVRKNDWTPVNVKDILGDHKNEI